MGRGMVTTKPLTAAFGVMPCRYLPCHNQDARAIYLRRLTKYLRMGYTCINGGENKVPQVIVTALRPKRLAAGVLNK